MFLWIHTMVKSVSVVIWTFESVRLEPSRVSRVESEYERTACRISLSGIGAQRGAPVFGSGCVMRARTSLTYIGSMSIR